MDKVVSQFLIFALIILALLFIIGGDHLTFRIFPILTTYAPIHLIKNPIQINEEEDNVSIVINNKYENSPDVKLLGVTNPLNLKGTTTPGRSSNISPTVTTNFPRPINNAAIPTIKSSPAFNSSSQNSSMPTPQNAPSAGGMSPQIAPTFTPISQGEVFVLPPSTPASNLPENQLSSSSNNTPFPQETPYPEDTPYPQETPSPEDTPSPSYAYETTSAPSLSSAYSSSYETTSASSPYETTATSLLSSDYSSPYETTASSLLSSDYSSPYETTASSYQVTMASSLSSDYSSPVTLSSYDVTTSTPTYAYETTAASSVSSAYSPPTTTTSTAVTTSTYSPGSSSQVTTYSSDASSSRYTTFSSN